MNELRPIFAAFHNSMARLYAGHILGADGRASRLVALSGAAAIVIGVGAGFSMTVGTKFRPLVERTVAIGQTFPPVAVLTVAAPLLGFGVLPALIALSLYGLLYRAEHGGGHRVGSELGA
jgi:osmoprotectant transport system permease protein